MIPVLLIALCGCTHVQLQRDTVQQGSTLTDIQYHQVLDNLAMFATDPNSLAWHVKVTGGVVQVADQGGAGFAASGVRVPFLAPNGSVMRNVLGQWNVDTVIEADDLELLQLAYQKAVNPADPNRELKKQAFEKICEISASFQIVLSEEVANELIDSLQIGATRERFEQLNHTRGRLIELYRRLDQLSVLGGPCDPQAAPPGQMPIPSPLTQTKREILRLAGGLCRQPFIPGHSIDKLPRGPMTVEQAEDKIHALMDLFSDRGEEPKVFVAPWVSVGCKKDVPRCACYVGHYRGCQRETYIWVMPEHVKTLRDFTLIVLSLVPPDVQEAGAPRLGVGAAFSPNF
jgi:hypothetical protein